MFSYPEARDILDRLGPDFLHAFESAVEGAREDIAELRDERASWFPTMAPRTLASLIHDRIWCRLVDALDTVPNVTCIDKSNRREVAVGPDLVLRIKRHKKGDVISTYPTATALEFYTQVPALPGLEQIPLALGYRWDSALRQIGVAVLSLRDGHDNVIWAVELTTQAGQSVVNLTTSEATEPSLPTIEVKSDAAAKSQGASGGRSR